MSDRPGLLRRRSKISGWGVFAAGPIPRRAHIVEYKGELISQSESARREERYLPRGRIWIFNINRLWVRDAGVGGNIARYINHSCRPNCYVEIDYHTIWIRASRRIAKGEELTYDYNTDGLAGISCRCRQGCRRIL
jgi:SET domain-containing protein